MTQNQSIPCSGSTQATSVDFYYPNYEKSKKQKVKLEMSKAS